MNTVDQREINNFNQLAPLMWDEKGPFKMLHQLNPLRIQYIIDFLDVQRNAKVLDVGCGGGLLSEPLARLGFKVTAIDVAPENIEVAKAHAQAQGVNQGLDIDYRVSTIEDFEQKEPQFDAVMMMEILEHINNIDLFLKAAVDKLKPGGVVFFSTINRTWMSYFQAIIAGEYLLKLVPKGTHQWQKFITPAEVHNKLESLGMEVIHLQGITYNIFLQRWEMTDKMEVNYMGAARKR